MIRTPRGFVPLLRNVTGSFRRKETARRLVFFCAAAILVMGTRTVSNVLRLLSLIKKLNPSTYHRLFSHRRWSSWNLARTIAVFIIDRHITNDTIQLCGDGTVDGHRGAGRAPFDAPSDAAERRQVMPTTGRHGTVGRSPVGQVSCLTTLWHRSYEKRATSRQARPWAFLKKTVETLQESRE